MKDVKSKTPERPAQVEAACFSMSDKGAAGAVGALLQLQQLLLLLESKREVPRLAGQ